MAAAERIIWLSVLSLLPSLQVGQRLLDGSYTIVNRVSGRRLCSNEQGFSATSGGEVYFFHRWRFHPLGDGTYAIVNAANAMRIFAQSGKGDADGFLTIDNGPVYQDQRWRPVLQANGSYSLINARSGRRMIARAGFEGAGGFGAVSDHGPISDEETWWLINPDKDETYQMLHEFLTLREGSCVQERAEVECSCPRAMCEESNEKQAEVPIGSCESVAFATRIFDDSSHHNRDIRTETKLQVCINENSMIAQESEALQFFLRCQAIVMLLLVLVSISPCYSCSWWRYFVFVAWPGGTDTTLAKLVAAPVLEDVGSELPLGAHFEHRVFCLGGVDSGTESSRIIKIQCPGVEHGDIEIEVLWNGVDITIRRRASLGVEATTWRKRFEFDNAEGPFEFREDQMQLEHGFLRLVFRSSTFRSRAVRFPQHFSLASTDCDLCWDCPASVGGGGDGDIQCAQIAHGRPALKPSSPSMAQGRAGGA